MRTLKLLLANAAVLCSTTWCEPADAAMAMFMGLGDLGGGTFSSSANGVSADGSVVVGSSNSASGGEAFRWTPSGGMVGMGDLPDEPFDSGASGVSADGSVIVGSGAVEIVSSHGGPPFRTHYRAFRWTQGQGMTSLGLLSNANETTSHGYGVSANGSVTVGMSGVHPINTALHGEAFRRTQGGAMIGLGVLPGYTYSDAWDVSADGSVIVGRSWSGARVFLGGEAFRWTQSSGMVGLGDLAGGQLNSQAYGVSADGAVVVGRGTSDAGSEAFRWTQSSGMVGLGILPGFDVSLAQDVSADGSLVVGYNRYNFSASGNDAFLWDATHGMRSLRDVLLSDFGLGASLAGWTLTSANDISADGQFIVGNGINPSGSTEAWIAHLVPELPGDYNRNGAVGPEDYALWKANFGSTTILAADGNNDGTVNAADYSVWRNHLGDSLGAGSGTADFGELSRAGASSFHAAVPEPSTLTLLLFGVTTLANAVARSRYDGGIRSRITLGAVWHERRYPNNVSDRVGRSMRR